jgi:hypothetical protein
LSRLATARRTSFEMCGRFALARPSGKVLASDEDAEGRDNERACNVSGFGDTLRAGFALSDGNERARNVFGFGDTLRTGFALSGGSECRS